jgi:predicted RNA binding protein YcfA (HicA-like mRNA interferase family)
LGTELPQLNGRELIAILQRAGWVVSRQDGSHTILKRTDGTGRIVVPVHSKDVTPGTMRNIIRAAGFTVEAFNEFRKG